MNDKMLHKLILKALARKPGRIATCTQVAKAVGISKPTARKHLRILYTEGKLVWSKIGTAEVWTLREAQEK